MSNNCKNCDSIKCSYAKQPGAACALFWTVADKRQTAAVSPSNSSGLLSCHDEFVKAQEAILQKMADLPVDKIPNGEEWARKGFEECWLLFNKAT
jgi:hypothetical protein